MNDQLFVLPVNGLKDYYPPAVRTATNLVKKVKLARFIGAQIITEDFETHMPVGFRALKHCWASACKD